MISKDSICINCDSTPKYKCPICRAPYCSVTCCQEHKLKCIKPPPPPEAEVITCEKSKFFFPTEDTLPVETLEKLRQSCGVKECLKNPHVRQIMSVIDKSSNPTDLLAQAMIEPIFVEFATECLKVVQPPDPQDCSLDED